MKENEDTSTTSKAYSPKCLIARRNLRFARLLTASLEPVAPHMPLALVSPGAAPSGLAIDGAGVEPFITPHASAAPMRSQPMVHE